MPLKLRIVTSAVVAMICSWAAVATFGLAADDGDLQDHRQAVTLRRPSALCVNHSGSKLFTANRDSGTVSVVDCDSLEVIDEIAVGGQPSDLLAVQDGKRDAIIVLDAADSQLLVLRQRGGDWVVSSRVAVADHPVRCIANQAGDRLYVASLWSRAISVFSIEDLRVEPIAKTRLPFEPRELCLSSDGKRLIVASAFSGQIATANADDLQSVKMHLLRAHNIRGLAVNSRNELLITCQHLNPIAHSTRDDVHWGNMISNLLLKVPCEELSSATGNIDAFCIAEQLGEPGNAAGDPGAIAMGPDGAIAVLLSGVDEVAMGNVQSGIGRRIPTGKRPVAAVSLGQRLFVANQFSDSLTVFDWTQSEEASTSSVMLGPQPDLAEAQIGEQLFFDSRLALDGWMSCHSCHTDGHTNGQKNDNLSDGSYGAAKQVLSLLGVGETGPWGWNGSVSTLHDQVVNSIENTMRGKSPNPSQVNALVAYMNQLAPPTPANSTYNSMIDFDVAKSNNAELVARGQKLFRSNDCVRCHVPPTFTSPKVYDVGLTDTVGHTKFNPPSLRGVRYRSSLFHDGRASSLEELLSSYRHQLASTLDDRDIAALVAYLKSL